MPKVFIMKSEITRANSLAKKWFLYSGIQTECSTKINGGFNAWYDPDNQSYSYIFSEITGYGLTFLSYLYSLQAQKSLLDRAKKAAFWLMRQATHHSGGVKTRYYFQETDDISDFSKKARTLYVFDTGMALFGICHLYRILKEERYLKYARQLAKFILSMQKPDGSFYALLDLTHNQKIDVPERWSTQSGSFHAKLSLGLLSLFELTGESLYKKAAIEICDWSIKFQKPDGRFVTFRDSGGTHLHPHCYSAEGLYFAGRFLNRNDYLQAAKRATEWAFSGQIKDGGIPSMFDKSLGWGEWKRTDVLSQALRLGILTLDKTHKGKLPKLVYRILDFQTKSKDKRANGGIKYGFDEKGKRLDHLNSWCTMFAYQALTFYRNQMLGGQPQWQFLV
jgi:hypothetical protein